MVCRWEEKGRGKRLYFLITICNLRWFLRWCILVFAFSESHLVRSSDGSEAKGEFKATMSASRTMYSKVHITLEGFFFSVSLK